MKDNKDLKEKRDWEERLNNIYEIPEKRRMVWLLNFISHEKQLSYEEGDDRGYRRGFSDKLTLLEQFQNYLLKHGYCDADVYAEEPTAINGFLKELEGLDK